jgi:hypothetical protein
VREEAELVRMLDGQHPEQQASMTLKMAVFAPMPSARERMAAAVNPGVRAMTRAA